MTLIQELEQSAASFNDFLAEVWAARQEELRLRLDALAQELAESEAKIQSVEEARLEAAAPPKLTVEAGDGGSTHQVVRVRCPGEGHWSFFIRLRASILGTHTFEVKVGELVVTAALNFSRGSRTHARLLPASGPRVFIRDFDPDSSNVVADAILLVAGPLLKGAVRGLIRRAIADALPSSATVESIEALRLADVLQVAPADPPAKDLAAKAREISERVQEEHLPFRSLLSARLSGPGAGDPLDTYTHFHDSAIWTGHYVAAEAFRHAASTGAAAKAAADNALEGLRGLEALVNIAGEKGLLSRVLVRSDSEHRKTMAAEIRHPLFEGSFRGVDYTSQTHITRDQYVGAFLGTGMALRFIDRDDVRKLASRLVRDMTRYLVDRQWCPEEAIPDPATGTRSTSVTYLASPSQILAILQLARRVDADAFEVLFQRYRAMSQVGWLTNWLQTLDPHSSYYKFNLEHSMALLLLGLEDDEATRAELADGFRTMRRALRRHANAYFDLVELTVFEDQPELLTRDRDSLAEECRGLLGDWLERPPIMEAADLSAADWIERVSFRKSADSSPETIARLPLPVAERPGTDFLWQRSPFSLKSLAVDPLRAVRPPGVDFLLPYWMARRLGVLAAS